MFIKCAAFNRMITLCKPDSYAVNGYFEAGVGEFFLLVDSCNKASSLENSERPLR
jgi:hypothetical protein